MTLRSANFEKKLSQLKTRENKPDYEIYNFKNSDDGKSWVLGDNSDEPRNAYKGYDIKCPENITIPRTLKNEQGIEKSVEIIGKYSFALCGKFSKDGYTKTILVTKQVKVIQKSAFSDLDDLESFEIETGSVLETIEIFALNRIGYNTGMYPVKRTGILILPSTLFSFSQDAINHCNLFHTIIYCGSHVLSKSSVLQMGVQNTIVNVTSQYPPNAMIFDSITPNVDAEADNVCQNFFSEFTYTNNTGNATITGLRNNQTSVLNIPYQIGDMRVVAIGESAFEDNNYITGDIHIPSSVTSIGDKAFAGLRNAGDIYIARGEELTIGNEAFAEYGIDREGDGIEVNLPSENVTIGARAFRGAKIKRVVVK